MLAVMSAKWVGDAISKSIYEELIGESAIVITVHANIITELKSIPFLEHHPPLSTYELTVTDVMKKPVVCINQVESLRKIVEILETTKHNGFPVVSYEGPLRPKTYRGLITRTQLLVLLERYLSSRCKIFYSDVLVIRQQYAGKGYTSPGLLDYDYYITLMNHKWQLKDVAPHLPPKENQDDFELDVSRCIL
jgi:hypothetical protein